ncbi:MAG: selenoneine biosynthesis selenosugar synthase SenB [Lautropia sp.]
MDSRPSVAIITPALASANNGNWHTASRWMRFLAARCRVHCAIRWDGGDADLMIALHARRSAQSIAAFHRTGRPVVVVLTGTDLYRDIHDDADAQASLAVADRLVCLQERGPQALPEALRARTRVVYQSASRLGPLPARTRSVDLLLVGHVRAEKDPMTAVRALSLLEAPDWRLMQIGQVPDDALGHALRDAAARDPRLVLLGARAHRATREHIRRARLLLLPSRIEGGANVLIEAAMSDVPVLASRIDGSVGMLGDDYAGYFEPGDAAALAALIRRCRDEPAFLAQLRAQVRARSPRFEASRERDAVRALVAELTGPGAT